VGSARAIRRAPAGLLAALLLAGAALELEAQGVLDALRRGVEAQAAFRRGKALYDARDYRAARERFAESLALDPAHDEARALLGWSQYFLGEYRAAIVTFKTALRRQPEWDGLSDGLGWSRLRLGRHHLAAEAFRAAIEKNPDNTDALVGLGSARFELGDYEAAEGPLRDAVRRLQPLAGAEPPELGPARAKLAWSVYYLQRYEEALALFEKGIRTTPELHGLHNGAGWCYLKLGRKPQARVAFQRALALRPEYQDAIEGLRQLGG
jgi:tetratricopeptide (TPR) repeat protein